MRLSRLTDMHAGLVTESISGGPADHAGIRAGDIILSLGSSVIAGVDSLQRFLTSETIGQPTPVTLLRDGSQLVLTVSPSEARHR